MEGFATRTTRFPLSPTLQLVASTISSTYYYSLYYHSATWLCTGFLSISLRLARYRPKFIWELPNIVGKAGLEPTASWSQTRRSTNWSTSRGPGKSVFDRAERQPGFKLLLYSGRDSNSHALRHQILNPEWLPIPPPKQVPVFPGCTTRIFLCALRTLLCFLCTRSGTWTRTTNWSTDFKSVVSTIPPPKHYIPDIDKKSRYSSFSNSHKRVRHSSWLPIFKMRPV